MNSMHQFEFNPCLSEECLQLQQLIDNEATDADDTLDLSTAFLIIKDIKINISSQNIINSVVLTRLFFESLDEPYSRYLSANYLTQSLYKLSFEEAEMRIIKLLTQGAMVEPPIFNNVEQALKFTRRLFQCIGVPYHFLANVNWHQNFSDKGASGSSVFQVGNCWDEGLVLISSTRVGALWFLGYD